MKIGLVDHVNIQTPDLNGTCRFYETVLGMTLGWRPEFPFPGAWLYADGHPVIHLIGLDPASPAVPPATSGRVHHIAFAGKGFGDLLARIEENGIPYDIRDVPGLQQRQLFLRDPNDIMVEIVLTGEDAVMGDKKYPVYAI